MSARVFVVCSSILSVASATSLLRTDTAAPSVIVPEKFTEMHPNGIPVHRMEQFRKMNAKAKAAGKFKPVMESNKMAVEAAPSGWIYFNSYANSTVYADGCTASPVEQSAVLANHCISDTTSSFMFTCTSTTFTTTTYSDAACTLTPVAATETLSCDMTNSGGYYEGVMENTKIVCGSSSSGLSWSVPTPTISSVTYSAAGCDSSTQIYGDVYKQNTCYGEQDDTLVATSIKYVAPVGSYYIGSLVCAGTAAGTQTITLDSCTLDDDASATTYTVWSENNSASKIMGNLSMISAFIGLAAVVLSIM